MTGISECFGHFVWPLVSALGCGVTAVSGRGVLNGCGNPVALVNTRKTGYGPILDIDKQFIVLTKTIYINVLFDI